MYKFYFLFWPFLDVEGGWGFLTVFWLEDFGLAVFGTCFVVVVVVVVVIGFIEGDNGVEGSEVVVLIIIDNKSPDFSDFKEAIE